MAKILLFVNSGWNVVNFRKHLLKELTKKKYCVTVMCPNDEYIGKLNRLGVVHKAINVERTGRNIFKEIFLFLKIFIAMRSLRPDVVLLFTIKPNIYGSLAATLLKIPFINNITGLGTTFLGNNLVITLISLFYKLSLYRSKRIFFQNIDDQRLFIAKKIIILKNSTVIPGSGIDLKKFQPVKSSKIEVKRKSFIFILISRLVWEKGVKEYLDAASDMLSSNLNVEFHILGSLDQESSRAIPENLLFKWIKDNRIKYFGFKQDVRPYIKQADCIVLPSHREGTSRTLLEAAAMGKPIITSDVPGCNNVVTHDYNGFLCKSKSKDNLVYWMKKMMNKSFIERHRMGQLGRQIVENEFDEKIISQRYLEEINTILLKNK